MNRQFLFAALAVLAVGGNAFAQAKGTVERRGGTNRPAVETREILDGKKTGTEEQRRVEAQRAAARKGSKDVKTSGTRVALEAELKSAFANNTARFEAIRPALEKLTDAEASSVSELRKELGETKGAMLLVEAKILAEAAAPTGNPVIENGKISSIRQTLDKVGEENFSRALRGSSEGLAKGQSVSEAFLSALEKVYVENNTMSGMRLVDARAAAKKEIEKLRNDKETLKECTL